MSNSFYSKRELENIGFNTFGRNVLISRKASIYGANNISIGNNIRIDDFCILSGRIKIGNYVHIGAGTYLFGGSKGIYIDDFASLSSQCCVYAITDDYTGGYLTNPTILENFRNIIEKPIYIKKHVIIGTKSVILPGVTLEEGVSIGASSLINKDLPAWSICFGIPARRIRERKYIDESLFLNK